MAYVFVLESSQNLNLSESSLAVSLVLKGRDLLYGNFSLCLIIVGRPVRRESISKRQYHRQML